MTLVEPDAKANWINQDENDWDDLIPVADKKTKVAKIMGQERAIFKLFSNGVSTNRDDWVYDLAPEQLRAKFDYLVDSYTKSFESPRPIDPNFKWTRSLLRSQKSGRRINFEFSSEIANYRPLFKVSFCTELLLTENPYQITHMF